MLLSVVLSLALPLAAAEDCDAKALAAEVAEASNLMAPDKFAELAACDAAAANKIAAKEMPRFLGGAEGNRAVVAAIQIGATDPAVAWIDGLQSDERAKAIAALGEACPESEPVQDFFVNRSAALGEDFWKQRWYRALASCPVPKVQELLAAELDKGLGADRSRFFAIMETYARGSSGAAIPRLKGLLSGTKDAEAQSQIIGAFADAAQVGSVNGMDSAAGTAAVAAIVELAPGLEVKAIEQARLTLQALGAEQASDELAAVRFQGVMQEDGTFLWGTVTVEDAVCKNGKRFQRAHVAQVSEPGRTWPDQIEEKVQAAVEVVWELDLAAKCKGEGTVKVVVPPEPFAGPAEFKAWASEQVEAVKDEEAKKFIKMDQDKVTI